MIGLSHVVCFEAKGKFVQGRLVVVGQRVRMFSRKGIVWMGATPSKDVFLEVVGIRSRARKAEGPSEAIRRIPKLPLYYYYYIFFVFISIIVWSLVVSLRGLPFKKAIKTRKIILDHISLLLLT